MSYIRGPYSQGKLLLTQTVRGWCEGLKKRGQYEELLLIVSNFRVEDEGRSRELVAKARTPEDAERLVACLKACSGLTTAALNKGIVTFAIDKAMKPGNRYVPEDTPFNKDEGTFFGEEIWEQENEI